MYMYMPSGWHHKDRPRSGRAKETTKRSSGTSTCPVSACLCYDKPVGLVGKPCNKLYDVIVIISLTQTMSPYNTQLDKCILILEPYSLAKCAVY